MKTVEFANSVDLNEVAHYEFPTYCSLDEVFFIQMGHIMQWPPSVQISLTPLKTVFETWVKCLPYQENIGNSYFNNV